MISYLIGYGTLLYNESLNKTIGDSGNQKEFIPVIIKGYKRLFNLLPDHYKPSFKVSPLPVEKAAANVIPFDGFSFNGLALLDELNSEKRRGRLLTERYIAMVGLNEQGEKTDTEKALSALQAWLDKEDKTSYDYREIQRLLERFSIKV